MNLFRKEMERSYSQQEMWRDVQAFWRAEEQQRSAMQQCQRQKLICASFETPSAVACTPAPCVDGANEQEEQEEQEQEQEQEQEWVQVSKPFTEQVDGGGCTARHSSCAVM